MRGRILLLTILLVIFALATLGPGLISRRGQGGDCPPEKVGCGSAANANNAFDYHPNDGRVAGNAGDVLALYCQPEYRSVAVYGISNSAGAYLTSFEIDKVRAAGPTGLTVDLGPQGVVSMAAQDSGKLYIVLKGGAATAAGLDRFAKLFSCGF